MYAKKCNDLFFFAGTLSTNEGQNFYGVNKSLSPFADKKLLAERERANKKLFKIRFSLLVVVVVVIYICFLLAALQN